ncbi:MAG: AmmeMemoRadiSam system protein B [Magnetococcales bacterium]|nr:AmmeMemoRadiSam system protein B [Magnetococcales bacterium]NGZ26702.1 AmmeMemoRadiSam system protein B [Magnetococcales bacterium]
MWKQVILLAALLQPLSGLTDTATPANPPNFLQKAIPAKRVHQSELAGRWYPKEANEITAMIDRFFVVTGPSALPKESAPVRAILVPHAGYTFSGQTAAFAYKTLQGRTFKRVVVLGTAHRLSFGGLALTDVTHFATPLGEIPLDTAAIDQLSANTLANYIPRAFKGEHSVDVQLPLLQKSLSSPWSLVPVLVGQMDMEGFKKAADLIRPLLDHQTLLVISGDFIHYGPNYQFVPFPPDAKVAANIRQLDMESWERVQQRDLEGLITITEKKRLNSCAFGPLSTFIPLLPKDGRAILVRYDTSGALSGNYTNSVSYLASVFTSPDPVYVKPKREDMTQDHFQLLHKLAGRAMVAALQEGADKVNVDALVKDVSMPLTLKELGGAFVLLKKEGELRGSMGTGVAKTPIYQSVIENAVRAALFDSRFQPVEKDELDKLEITIQVLDPPRLIVSLEEIELGRHGILLSKGENQALFLPEVAVEQKWTLEETLSQLAKRAGLPEDGWLQGASVQIFTSRIYSAPFKSE